MERAALRKQINDDLSRQFEGELRTDDVTRSLFATDASIFQIDPLAVAIPNNESEVQTLVRYAFDHSLPIVPRGAGTGLAGESLSHGIVVDLSQHFRGILEIGPDWVRVQPGVVLDQLNVELARVGRRFAPDPSSSMACTIGGMIATNASGSRATKHGTTRDYLRKLRVVWDDGSADEIGVGPRASSAEPVLRTIEIQNGIANLIQANAELIAAYRSKAPLDRCGYYLHNLRSPNGVVDLPRLLAGSEGTLAFVTEATFTTIPLAGGRSAVALGFSTFEDALHASRLARELWPAANEILDRRLMSLIRAQSPEAAGIVPFETEAALLVEFERDTPAAARDAVRALIDTVQNVHHLAVFVVPAEHETVANGLWAVRKSALPSLYAIGKGARPLPFVEDIGVHPDDVLDFVQRAKGILKRFDLTASFLVHASTGQIHVRPFIDPDSPEDAAKLWPVAEEIHSVAIDLGGTVSAQHGTGLARTPWVERQFGRLYPVFREVKRIFDPRGILNPGKIVGPDPGRPAWPLRRGLPQRDPGTRSHTPILVWQPEEMERAISACNGCGACRAENLTVRMCPVFRGTNSEAAAPRAKANMLRVILESASEKISDKDVRDVADLCVNCKMCVSECPGKVDIPKLMLEAKAAHHAAHGLSRSAWLMARFDGLVGFGSQFSLMANFLLGRQSFRWLFERTFGLSRRRLLPAFSFRTFMGRARRRGWTKRISSGPGVAYFVDTFANAFDPSIAEATMAVLRHNGVPVYVPPRQRGTGAAALAQGDTDIARERLAYNVKHLADCVRQGDSILCSEPTAALFFRNDAFGLSDDPEVKLIAEKTIELSDFLWSLHEAGNLKTDFRSLDLNVGHHIPCHVKALGRGAAGPKLLSLIPGVRVSTIDRGCSGMAGTFGFNVKNHPISLRAGREMLEELSRPRHTFGSAECSACRMQMQDGTGKRALHPVQYLALAYGLLPALGDRLRRPLRGLVSS